MIRRFAEWLLNVLGIRKRVRKSALECLMDVLPVVYTAAILVGIVKQFGPFPLLPWYKRLWFRIKRIFQRTRMVVVGY